MTAKQYTANPHKIQVPGIKTALNSLDSLRMDAAYFDWKRS